MIFTEKRWNGPKVAIVEIVPLDGQSKPDDFKPFYMRLQIQGMHPQLGSIQKMRDVKLMSDDVSAAMVEAEGLLEAESKALADELQADIRKATSKLVIPTNGSGRKQALARM